MLKRLTTKFTQDLHNERGSNNTTLTFYQAYAGGEYDYDYTTGQFNFVGSGSGNFKLVTNADHNTVYFDYWLFNDIEGTIMTDPVIKGINATETSLAAYIAHKATTNSIRVKPVPEQLKKIGNTGFASFIGYKDDSDITNKASNMLGGARTMIVKLVPLKAKLSNSAKLAIKIKNDTEIITAEMQVTEPMAETVIK